MSSVKKRFPFLLWGDLVEGRAPVLRRALAGFRAHECMYAWVYLTEYLAHRRLLDATERMSPGELGNLLAALDGPLWQQLERKVLDPHHQLSADALVAVAHMACIAAASAQSNPTFVELGSTFFAARTKFQILECIARARFADWPPMHPHWTGIDNSPFMHDTTRELHREREIELLADYRAFRRRSPFPVFLSRFVASYAFQSSADFANYLADGFEAAVVEDAHSTTAEELNVFNHGQAEVFFSIPELLGGLERRGFAVYLLGSYPDHPAGAAPCHVIRYLAARPSLVNQRYRNYLDGLGVPSGLEPVHAASLLDRLNASIPPSHWSAVARAKRESPVWGPTPAVAAASGRERLVRRLQHLVRYYLIHGGWRRYRFRGPMAEREIHRALSEEQP